MIATKRHILDELAAQREALLIELDHLHTASVARSMPLEERTARLARITDDITQTIRAERRAFGIA